MSEMVRAILLMSVSVSILALLLFVINPLIKKRIPKWAQYCLWLVVIVALLIPLSRVIVVPDSDSSPIPPSQLVAPPDSDSSPIPLSQLVVLPDSDSSTIPIEPIHSAEAIDIQNYYGDKHLADGVQELNRPLTELSLDDSSRNYRTSELGTSDYDTHYFDTLNDDTLDLDTLNLGTHDYDTRDLNTCDFDTEVTSLMEKLALDMWVPYITLTPFEIPEYVENNAATRLAMRWPDFYLTEIGNHPGNRLVSIDSIDTSIQQGQLPVGGMLTVSGTSEIRYTRVNPSVNGVNVLFNLVIDVTGKNLKIVDIDMVFDSRYRSMKEEVERITYKEEPSIQIIDSIIDDAIRSIR